MVAWLLPKCWWTRGELEYWFGEALAARLGYRAVAVGNFCHITWTYQPSVRFWHGRNWFFVPIALDFLQQAHGDALPALVMADNPDGARPCVWLTSEQLANFVEYAFGHLEQPRMGLPGAYVHTRFDST